MKLIDGVNAFPLCTDVRGISRSGNVEADLLLLARNGSVSHLFLCEVKHRTNEAWYATVECLRQFRLFQSSPKAKQVFAYRGSLTQPPLATSLSALVIAPEEFYNAPGKKRNAVKPAWNLIGRFKQTFDLKVTLAVWDHKTLEIRGLSG